MSWQRGLGDVARRVQARPSTRALGPGASRSRHGGRRCRPARSRVGLGNGYTVFEPFAMWGQVLPRNAFLQMHGGVELPSDSARGARKCFCARRSARPSRRTAASAARGRRRSKLLWARPEGGAVRVGHRAAGAGHVVEAAARDGRRRRARAAHRTRRSDQHRRSSICCGTGSTAGSSISGNDDARAPLVRSSAVVLGWRIHVGRASAPTAPQTTAGSHPLSPHAARPIRRCSPCRVSAWPATTTSSSPSGRRRLDRRELARNDDGQLGPRSVLPRERPPRRRSITRLDARTSRTNARRATCRRREAAARAAGGTAQVFAHLSERAVGPADRARRRSALDGVTCTVCHQIAPDRLGTREQLQRQFRRWPAAADGARRAFGPFDARCRPPAHHALGDGLRAGAGAAHPRVGALRDAATRSSPKPSARTAA